MVLSILQLSSRDEFAPERLAESCESDATLVVGPAASALEVAATVDQSRKELVVIRDDTGQNVAALLPDFVIDRANELFTARPRSLVEAVEWLTDHARRTQGIASFDLPPRPS